MTRVLLLAALLLSLSQAAEAQSKARIDTSFVAAVAFFSVGSTLDHLTTVQGIDHGLREVNPFWRRAIEQDRFLATEVAYQVGTVVLASLLRRRSPRLSRNLLLVLGSVHLGAAGRNFVGYRIWIGGKR